MAPPVFPALAGIITARDRQFLRRPRPSRVPNTLPIPSAPFLSFDFSPSSSSTSPPFSLSSPLLPGTARTLYRVQLLLFSIFQRFAFAPCPGKVYPRSAALSGSSRLKSPVRDPEGTRLAQSLLGSINSASIASAAFQSV
ncbi:hypothetical protein N7523_006969 [Penicillium sp. IBT 18751x]|nr:hypothetical protein N7523_006969 [Penicillium sp. IBT 18751x]